jgi:hypothetical protein
VDLRSPAARILAGALPEIGKTRGFHRFGVGPLLLGGSILKSATLKGRSFRMMKSAFDAELGSIGWGLAVLLLHRNMGCDPKLFLSAVAPYRDDMVVATECIFCLCWLADLCTREGITFVLGHALCMKAIRGGKAKNDKIDDVSSLDLLQSIPGVGTILSLTLSVSSLLASAVPAISCYAVARPSTWTAS